MANTTNSETYDGTTWSEVNNLNTARDKAGAAGTQAAAVVYGGFISPPAGSTDATEEYDSTSWSTVPGVLSQDLSQMAAFGTQTAAVSAGGYNYSASPPKHRAITEEYNGSTWTANPSPSGDLPAAKSDNSGAGTQTAGLSIGGAPTLSTTEEYDGSTWSAGGALIAGKDFATAAGIQTDAIISGGSTGTVVYGYDGSAWSTRPSMAISRDEVGGTTPAPASSTMAIGGSPGAKSTTEVFTGETETGTASIITSS